MCEKRGKKKEAAARCSIDRSMQIIINEMEETRRESFKIHRKKKKKSTRKNLKRESLRATDISTRVKRRRNNMTGGDVIRSPRTLSIEDCSLQEIYESVRELLLETLKEDEGWKGLTRDDISVEPLSGGITNKMFKCEPPKPMTPVVTRVYGSSTDKFVSRTDESEMALTLNKSNFGAKVRAVFQNGWVEDFIESSSLVPLDMRKKEILTTVAGIIKRFHELDMPHRIARPQTKTGIAKTSTPNEEGSEAIVAGEFWETIELWYSMALEVSFPEDPEKQKLLDALCVPQLKEKIKRVMKMCDATNSPTVFCHNDIHAGNFLVEEPSKKLILIDFEYSAHGPRGFDLANFFCEFAGFECDYSLLPDKATREVFYEIYLSDGDTVEQLEKEVEVFYIATHLFWGIWSVLQSKFSPIQFDFLDYARMRLRQFSVLLGENADSMSPSKQDSPLATPKSPNAPSSWGTVNEAHFTKSPRHSLDKNNTR